MLQIKTIKMFKTILNPFFWFLTAKFLVLHFFSWGAEQAEIIPI